jgi:hypothetical protein
MQVDSQLAHKAKLDGMEAECAPCLALHQVSSHPVRKTEPRANLQARLENRTQQELSKISDQLCMALETQLSERRQELCEQLQSLDAEVRRQSEHDLAQKLRDLNEDEQLSRLNAAIKLNAMRSRLALEGGTADRLKSEIAAKEKELGEARSRLAKDAKDLSTKITSSVDGVCGTRRCEIDKELADTQAKERRRIEELVRSKSEQLRFEFKTDGLIRPVTYGSGPMEVASAGTEARTRAARERLVASRAFVNGADRSSKDLKLFRLRLKNRISIELESTVRRIARENGLQVTFAGAKNAENKTGWFRSRLPYVTGNTASSGKDR